MPSRGVRIVAMTVQFRSRKKRAVSRPKPEEQPVMRIVLMGSDLLLGWQEGRQGSPDDL
jgi:hypothetical protein